MAKPVDKNTSSSTATSAEDVATWLARETGHSPSSNEGYAAPDTSASSDTAASDQQGYGLPNKNHEKLRRFFDGLHIQNAMNAKRKADALNNMDETQQMNDALKQALPQPGQPGQPMSTPNTPPGGGS